MADKDLEEKIENLQNLVLAQQKQIALAMVMGDSVRQALESLGVSTQAFEQIHAKTLAGYEESHRIGLEKAIDDASDEKLRQSLEDLPGRKQ